MSKHIPGPWSVDGPADNQIVWSGPTERVCFLAHSNGCDPERDIATGFLVAAAPELFEALSALHHATDLRNIRGLKHIPSMRQQQDAMLKASAALAKAEGRS